MNNTNLTQARAKKIAERLLGRRVQMKTMRGQRGIFPERTKDSAILSFVTATRYYGPTWDEAIAALEARIQFDTKTGAPIEGQLVKCPNCGDSEHLSARKIEGMTVTLFECETCNNTFQRGANIEAVDSPPEIARATGLPEGSILVPSGTSTREDNMEPENKPSPPKSASELQKMHEHRHPGDKPPKPLTEHPVLVPPAPATDLPHNPDNAKERADELVAETPAVNQLDPAHPEGSAPSQSYPQPHGGTPPTQNQPGI